MTGPTNEKLRLERVTTGVPRLDTVLKGGLIRGGLYVVQGPPGSGKTVLANQCCFHHIESGGKNAVYITLLAESTGRMMAFLETLDFANPKLVSNRVHYFSGYSALKDKGVSGLLSLLKKVVAEHKTTFLVVDGIDNVEAMATSIVAYREFIHSLQTFVSIAQCTTLLLTPSLPSAREAGPELAVSDGVIELGKQQLGPRTIREIQIHKFRG